MVKDNSMMEDEDMMESSDEQLGYDLQHQAGNKNYPSDINPRDFFQYKKLRINPDAATDHPSFISKDLVFGNAEGAKPNTFDTKYCLGTLNLIKKVFTISKKVIITDDNGKPIKRNNEYVIEDIKVFDELFEPVLSTLHIEMAGWWVASRSIGKDREAVLDVSTSIRKEYMRKKDEKDKIVGI